ncbi:uncharacterized protein LOC121144156 [Mesocricetus auratus]|uniref:Uncharacterized protein LOC121144156 n=1 Tax=Mesocricetus auratus TaxID=10036 RepID=A0ABM2YF68_MESAU|nr:uncharacterized protein LOC121144156 [Mesocricetus auratus]
MPGAATGVRTAPTLRALRDPADRPAALYWGAERRAKRRTRGTHRSRSLGGRTAAARPESRSQPRVAAPPVASNGPERRPRCQRGPGPRVTHRLKCSMIFSSRTFSGSDSRASQLRSAATTHPKPTLALRRRMRAGGGGRGSGRRGERDPGGRDYDGAGAVAAGRFPPARVARLPPPGHRPLAAGARASSRPDAEFLPAGAQARGAPKWEECGAGKRRPRTLLTAQARRAAGGWLPEASRDAGAASPRGQALLWGNRREPG